MPLLSLLRLDLSNNLIQTVSDDSFTQLPALTDLILKNNKIGITSNQAFSANSQLNLLDLSNNQLTAIPNIVALSNLNYLDLSNQNGNLVALADNSFDRAKVSASNNLNVNLKSNSIVKFGTKTFCSSYFNYPSISNLQLSYASSVTADKCLLRQLSQRRIPNDVTVTVQQEAGADYSSICSCSSKVFFDSYKIRLTEACDPSITGCTNVPVQDDCSAKAEFSCPTISPTTVTVSSPTATSSVGSTTVSSSGSSSATSVGPTQTGSPRPVDSTTINYNKNNGKSNKAISLLSFVIFLNSYLVYNWF